MERRPILKAGALSSTCLSLAKSSHHCVAVEVIRLSASEHGWLLGQEKLLCFLAIVLFCLGVDKR